MINIIFVILIILILVCLFNYFNIIKLENFVANFSNKSQSNIINRFNPNNSINSVNSINSPNQKNNLMTKIDEKILFSNKDYNENLSIDNKNNQYFYDDIINQSNINETAFNIEYSIDPIDYADVKTGIQKCNEECKGVCFENGYDGVATCYPMQTQPFDWGTLYKNPTFTYGYNAYGPQNLPK